MKKCSVARWSKIKKKQGVGFIAALARYERLCELVERVPSSLHLVERDLENQLVVIREREIE